MSLLDPRRHAAARQTVTPQPEPPIAKPTHTIPFFGGTIRGTANVSVYVHPAADLAQLREMRAVLDREIAKREART